MLAILKIITNDNWFYIVVKLKPSCCLSEILQRVKGNSSKWINDKKCLPRRFSWQRGYGAFSVSESQVETVIRYVKNQAKHHRTFSFREEFVKLLEKHRVCYDERYLWD